MHLKRVILILKTVDQQEAINKIKHYDEIIKTGNKNTIRYESIEGQMLKKFKDTEGLLKTLELFDQQFILKLDFTNF